MATFAPVAESPQSTTFQTNPSRFPLVANIRLDSDGRWRRHKPIRMGDAMRRPMESDVDTTPFMELFLQPRHRLHLPSAVTALLAGELEGGWKVRWRMKLFFWLVKMQARWPLVPRISFAAQPEAPRSKPAPSSQTEEVAHHL